MAWRPRKRAAAVVLAQVIDPVVVGDGRPMTRRVGDRREPYRLALKSKRVAP
jgi:hypothetical protein